MPDVKLPDPIPGGGPWQALALTLCLLIAVALIAWALSGP
jgi:hypothetical protein